MNSNFRLSVSLKFIVLLMNKEEHLMLIFNTLYLLKFITPQKATETIMNCV